MLHAVQSIFKWLIFSVFYFKVPKVPNTATQRHKPIFSCSLKSKSLITVKNKMTRCRPWQTNNKH